MKNSVELQIVDLHIRGGRKDGREGRKLDFKHYKISSLNKKKRAIFEPPMGLQTIYIGRN